MALTTAKIKDPNRTGVPNGNETAAARKARGAFYTPPSVTAFMASWAIRSADDRVLEPSAGDGSFLVAAAQGLQAVGVADPGGRLLGIELSAVEARKARAAAPGASVVEGSFFDIGADACPGTTVVLGNPPYLRYHAFGGESRARGLARAEEQGVELSGLASSWAHFVVHAASFLPVHGGRLALVLPAELLHTDYAQPVRAFLLRRFRSIVVIAFDQQLFSDAEVDAVILLASDDDAEGLHVIRTGDASDLAALVIAGSRRAVLPDARWSRELDDEAASVSDELLATKRFVALGALGSVDIGLVTGANHFFVLDDDRLAALRLPDDAVRPILARPGSLAGLQTCRNEHRWLLALPPETPLLADPAIAAYLDAGLIAGVPSGYKCRTRRAWHSVPIPGTDPDLFIPYMSHARPRLILNTLKARATNLIHGVRLNVGVDAMALAAAALSAGTALSAEIEGRSYGGGVLKLETREAERLLVPVVDDLQAAMLRDAFPRLDGLLRTGKMDTASRIVDDILGLDHDRMATSAASFRERRHGRSRSPEQHRRRVAARLPTGRNGRQSAPVGA